MWPLLQQLCEEGTSHRLLEGDGVRETDLRRRDVSLFFLFKLLESTLTYRPSQMPIHDSMSWAQKRGQFWVEKSKKRL